MHRNADSIHTGPGIGIRGVHISVTHTNSILHLIFSWYGYLKKNSLLERNRGRASADLKSQTLYEVDFGLIN